MATKLTRGSGRALSASAQRAILGITASYDADGTGPDGELRSRMPVMREARMSPRYGDYRGGYRDSYRNRKPRKPRATRKPTATTTATRVAPVRDTELDDRNAAARERIAQIARENRHNLTEG